MPPGSPSFDLVVATIGRTAQLERLLTSLEGQTYRGFRVLIVDQNESDLLVPLVEAHNLLELIHLRSAPGLSHARNRGLAEVVADIVAFPDDDCAYGADLLERVASRLAEDSGLDGLTGRAASAAGRSERSWKLDRARLTTTNLWNRASSCTIFLRRTLVERVGSFDERLGLGSSERWSSGEEIDYLIRAIRRGARIEYDPGLTVEHELARYDTRLAFRDGASIGYLLRKHDYPTRTVGRMLVRPLGGAVVSLARRDPGTAHRHLATLRGRVRGYLGARRSKISA